MAPVGLFWIEEPHGHMALRHPPQEASGTLLGAAQADAARSHGDGEELARLSEAPNTDVRRFPDVH